MDQQTQPTIPRTIRCYMASVGEIALTAATWQSIRSIAKRECLSLNEVLAYINAVKLVDVPLNDSVTLFTEIYFRELAAEQASGV